MLKKAIIPFLIFVFLALNISTRHSGWTNAASRYLFLCALVTRGTFNIDDPRGINIDWAQTPDGRFYSNKAPGAVFAAAPVFWIIQKIDVLKNKSASSNYEICMSSSFTARLFLLSLILQVGGCLLVLRKGLNLLRKRSEGSRVVFTATLLFGSTAACLMNTFFGHALAGIFLLAALFYGIERQIAKSSFFWGWALLTDYGVLWSLPGFSLLWFALPSQNSKNVSVMNTPYSYWTAFKSIALGSCVPACLWITYHTSAFGSPWSLPNKFQNPLFVEKSNYAMWGVLNFFPHPNYIYELLFGSTRGLLWTQPWILALFLSGPILLGPARLRFAKTTTLVGWICFSSLAGLIMMNASFNGWHGGHSPGPRYLSPIFLVFCFWLALIWDDLHSIIQKALIPSIVFSMLFTVLALIHGAVIPVSPLWPHLYNYFVHSHP